MATSKAKATVDVADLEARLDAVIASHHASDKAYQDIVRECMGTADGRALLCRKADAMASDPAYKEARKANPKLPPEPRQLGILRRQVTRAVPGKALSKPKGKATFTIGAAKAPRGRKGSKSIAGYMDSIVKMLDDMKAGRDTRLEVVHALIRKVGIDGLLAHGMPSFKAGTPIV